MRYFGKLHLEKHLVLLFMNVSILKTDFVLHVMHCRPIHYFIKKFILPYLFAGLIFLGIFSQTTPFTSFPLHIKNSNDEVQQFRSFYIEDKNAVVFNTVFDYIRDTTFNFSMKSLSCVLRVLILNCQFDLTTWPH